MGRVLGGEEAGGDVGDELVLGRTVHRGNLGAILLANGGALDNIGYIKRVAHILIKLTWKKVPPPLMANAL